MSHLSFFSHFTEDQQAIEDEGGIVLPMRNMYQSNVPQRPVPQIMASSFAANAMMPYNNNAAMFYGNQQFAMAAMPPPTYPVQNAPPTSEVQHRKKSIIENINPFISENTKTPADLLKSFPVSFVFEDYSIILFLFLYDILYIQQCDHS